MPTNWAFWALTWFPMSSADRAAKLRFCAACLAEPSPGALAALDVASTWQPWLGSAIRQLMHTGLDAWRGEHTRLFVAPALAPPFASAFREGGINGAAADEAQDFYATLGLASREGLPADYLGSLLECEAYLLENATVQDAEAFRRAFMADWIERFVDRLLEHSTLEFYRGLGERLLMLHGAGGRGTSGVLM
jgi:putative dimethyl sulfoxide reductase chaperone